MKPDMRTWVEAASTKHLRDGMPLEQTPVYLVGRVLVQLLWYWRYDLPASWGSLTNDLDYTSVALRMKDCVPLTNIDNYARHIKEALAKGGWPSITALPDIIWKWIEQMTGLNKCEWETIPETAEMLLSTVFECPRCGQISDFRNMGDLTDISDPFAFFSTNHFRFSCFRCNTPYILEAYHIPRKKLHLKWSELRPLIYIAALVLLGLGLIIKLNGVMMP